MPPIGRGIIQDCPYPNPFAIMEPIPSRQLVLFRPSRYVLSETVYMPPPCQHSLFHSVLCCNLLVIFPIEGVQAFQMALQLGLPTLLLNASLTFGLNLASVWLIGCASGLVLTLAGVVKDM